MNGSKQPKKSPGKFGRPLVPYFLNPPDECVSPRNLIINENLYLPKEHKEKQTNLIIPKGDHRVREFKDGYFEYKPFNLKGIEMSKNTKHIVHQDKRKDNIDTSFLEERKEENNNSSRYDTPNVRLSTNIELPKLIPPSFFLQNQPKKVNNSPPPKDKQLMLYMSPKSSNKILSVQENFVLTKPSTVIEPSTHQSSVVQQEKILTEEDILASLQQNRKSTERFAGSSWSNSPPPSSLPIPRFENL